MEIAAHGAPETTTTTTILHHEERPASDSNTIRDLQHWADSDPQEQTIRPMPKKSEKSAEQRPHSSGNRRQKSSKAVVTNSVTNSLPQARSPSKPQFPAKFEIPPRPDALFREQSVEDYSDFFGDNENMLDQRLKLVVQDSPQLFHPSDLTSLPRSTQSPVTGSMREPPPPRPSILIERQPMRRAKTTTGIEQFAEAEGDDDYSDVFGPEETLTERDESDRASEDGQLMLFSKLSGSSWLGDDEDEDDPFAVMDQGWDEMDLEANIARDRHARLAEKVEELVRSLKTTEGEDILSELAEDLVSSSQLTMAAWEFGGDANGVWSSQLSLLWENGEAKNMIITAHGLLPILEILEPCTVKSRQRMILHLLKIVNAIILDDVELQENLCFVGGIPIITKFAARQYSNEIRLEAAAFVRQMYQTSTLTLQMFVSAGGLNVLVEFLDEDYDSSRDLALIGVNGIWNVFELQGPTPKNDFCRIFSRSKILDPLALILHKVLDEDDDQGELCELIEGRIVNIFYLFSQAENYVKEVVADRQVLKTVLKDLSRMTPVHQITMLKFIKNLSMLSTTLESLHSADAIDFLIDVLGQSMRKGQKHFREISNHVLNTMFNLCRLSKERQEYAAGNGLIPLLMKILKTDHPPKEFVLPILCDMAHSGSKGRRYLWQNKGLDFYMSLIADQYWQATALDAILVWLQEETAKVESHLLAGNFTTAIMSCFNTTKMNAFDPNLLEPLQKVLRLSPALAASLAQAQMYAGIAQKLGHKKAIVRLNLLRLVRSIMDGCETDSAAVAASNTSNTARQLRVLFDDIRTLADKDSAVLVRNLASELIKSEADLDLHHEALLAPSASSNAGSGPRPRAGPRRATSYTPPGAHSSLSMPPTPTHAYPSHVRPPTGFIEVAATPKRTNVTSAYERDAALYRPRSRDGAGLLLTSIPRRVSGETNTAGGSAMSLGPAAGAASSLTNLAAVAAPPSAKSRLPRGSMHSRRPSINTAVMGGGGGSRSESVSSNKENFQRAGSGGSASSSSGGGGGGGQDSGVSPSISITASTRSREASFNNRTNGSAGAGGSSKRRSRAPSSDVKRS